MLQARQQCEAGHFRAHGGNWKRRSGIMRWTRSAIAADRHAQRIPRGRQF